MAFLPIRVTVCLIGEDLSVNRTQSSSSMAFLPIRVTVWFERIVLGWGNKCANTRCDVIKLYV